jgi:hypothetical protein
MTRRGGFREGGSRSGANRADPGRGWHSGGMSNRLSEATSPYLLQHAENPVGPML